MGVSCQPSLLQHKSSSHHKTAPRSPSYGHTRPYDHPPRHSLLSYPPHHTGHRPPPISPPQPPLPSRHSHDKGPLPQQRRHSDIPCGKRQQRISHDYPINGRVYDHPVNGRISPSRRDSAASPHRQISRNYREPDSRISPHSKGSVISPRSIPNGSPSHFRNISHHHHHHRHHHHHKARRHSSHTAVKMSPDHRDASRSWSPPPPPPALSSPPCASSSAWHRSWNVNNVKTEFKSPEQERQPPLPYHNGYRGSPPDHLPFRPPPVKEDRIIKEICRTPSPPPPHTPPQPPSLGSPLPLLPSTPLPPPPPPRRPVSLSAHSPDPPTGCIPRQRPLSPSLSLKKRRRLFTEEDGRGNKELNSDGKKGNERCVDTNRRRHTVCGTEQGTRTPTLKATKAKRERPPGKSLPSYDSTPEISPVQKKRKRKLSDRLSSQISSRQTRLDMFFSDDRDITPPLEPKPLSPRVTGGNHRELAAPGKGAALTVPCVVLNFPAKPDDGGKHSDVSGGGSGVQPHPPIPQSLTSEVKRESKVKQEPDKKLLEHTVEVSQSSSSSFSSVVEAKCSGPENLPRSPLASVCESHMASPLPPLPSPSSPPSPPPPLPPPSPPVVQVAAIPAWSTTELQMKGENSPDQLEVRVGVCNSGGLSAVSNFPPAPKSSWNFVVVHMDRHDAKFVESLEEIVNKGFCIPSDQINVVLRHILSVSDQNLLLRLNSVLTIDSTSRSVAGLPSKVIWNLVEDCCRQLFPSSGTPPTSPGSYPHSAHTVLLYLSSLLVADAAATTNLGRLSLVQQILSPATHWRHVRVVVDLFLELLVRPPPSSPLPDLLPVLARLLSMCSMCSSLVSRQTGAGDGAVRLARELSSRMSKLSSLQLKAEFIRLIPCHSLCEKIINIHLQTEFPLPTPSLDHTPLSSDHVTLEVIAATHLHRYPNHNHGLQQDLTSFLFLLFHLLHYHCSRLLDPPAAATLTSFHPDPSPSSLTSSTSNLPPSPAFHLPSTSHPLPSPSSTRPPITSSTSPTSHSLPSPTSPHPSSTTSTTCLSPAPPSTSLSPVDLARKLNPISNQIQQLLQRLLEDGNQLQELTSPDCWFYLRLLQNMFSWQHITK